MSGINPFPFDQRIVNPLERPTSEDFNLIGSQMNTGLRMTMDWLCSGHTTDVPPYYVPTQYGFLGDSFRVTLGGGMRVRIQPGVGYLRVQPRLDIDGINGVSSVNLYDTGTYSLTPVVNPFFPLNIDVPAAPPVLYACRRDVIAVRAWPIVDDPTASDIFDTTAQVFQTQTRYKQLRYAIPQAPYFTPIGGGTDFPEAASLIYAQGEAASYSNPNSFLSAPLPTIPSDFVVIAVINVGGAVTSIKQSHIADFRPLMTPGGFQKLYGRFQMGAEQTSPGVWEYGRMLDYTFMPTTQGLRGLMYGDSADFSAHLGALITYPATGTNLYQAFQTQRLRPPNGWRITDDPAQAFMSVMGNTLQDGSAEAQFYTVTSADRVKWADPAYNPKGTGNVDDLDIAIGQPYTKYQFAVANVIGFFGEDNVETGAAKIGFKAQVFSTYELPGGGFSTDRSGWWSFDYTRVLSQT